MRPEARDVEAESVLDDFEAAEPVNRSSGGPGLEEDEVHDDGDTAHTAHTAHPGEDAAPRRRRPPARLDEAAYYGPLGALVKVIEPHTEADSAAVLLQAIVYFGNVIGRGPHLVAEARKHFTNLFAGIVGTTSKGRKGSSNAHIERAFLQIDESWLRGRVVAGLSSGEGLIWSVRDPITKLDPIKEKGKVIDYQEVKVDPGVSDKRVLFREEELSGVLAVMGRQGNSLSPTIRTAWDTGNLNTVVKNNPAKATDAHVSITGHTTKDELLRNLDDTQKANGFANRIIWLFAKRSKELPFGGHLADDDMARAVRPIAAAVDFARKLGERCLTWDHEAADLWRSVYSDLSAGRPGLLGAVTSRAEAQTIRLALVFAVADCSTEIRRPHLEAALAIWKYAEESARFIFGDALGDPLADEILALLRRAGAAGLARNEIRDAFRRHRTSDEISRALEVLSDNGFAHMVREETRGRPAERWFAGQRTGAESAESAESPERDHSPEGHTAHTAHTAHSREPGEDDE